MNNNGRVPSQARAVSRLTRRRALGVFAACGTVALVLASCSSSPATPAASSSTPFRVLFIDGLSGGFAPIGNGNLAGMNAAVSVINSEGGILGHKVELTSKDDQASPQDAVNILQKAGYRATDIAVLSSDNQGSKDFAHEKHSKAPQGAATGAAAGAVIGAALAWYISIQTVTITGLGALTAAGPVGAALAGAGAGGALGWIVGLLAGLGLTEYVAKRFAGRIRSGGILLSVHCDSPEWCTRAKKALKDTGARNISSASEAAADYGTTDKPTERAPVIITDRSEVPVQQTAERVADETKKQEASAAAGVGVDPRLR